MAKYFTDGELACRCCSSVGTGIDQRLQDVLDAMRETAGVPLQLSCAYRCEQHNTEVGGVPNSYHCQGIAADILIPDGFTVDDLASIAEQCGADGIGRYYGDGFVHVDTRGYAARWEE